jgi:hypothetical protein
MSGRQPKLSEVVMSKTSMITIMCVAVILIFSGCTGKDGIIRLNTEPAGAYYFVDGIERGTTPAEFEWRYDRPILIELKKEGYYTEEEMLNKGWLHNQMYQGNYGTVRVGGAKKKWTVTINRKLKAAPQ